MADFSVHNTAELQAALASSDSTVNIRITSDFSVTSNITIPAGKTVTITSDSTKHRVTRGTFGDLITLGGNSTLTISNLTIDGYKSNYPDARGSLISSGYSDNTKLNLLTGAELIGNANPSENDTGGNGGAVHLRDSTLALDHASISGNEAKDGGGIHTTDTDVSITDSTFINNKASEDGAGMYVYSSETPVDFSGAEFINNTARNDGGGLYLDAKANINNSTFRKNTGRFGGAVYLAGSTSPKVSFYNTNFTSNTADYGGAIYNVMESLYNLDVSATSSFSNNKGVTNTDIIKPEDVPIHKAHIKTTQFTSPHKYAYNNDDIFYYYNTSNNYTFGDGTNNDGRTDENNRVKKTLSDGGTLSDKQFQFGLFDENGKQVAAGTNDLGGNVTFSKVLFDEITTHHYTVKELPDPTGKYSYDKTVYPVTVSVTYNGGDNNRPLMVRLTWEGGNPPEFKNKRTCGEAPVNISTKVISPDKKLSDGEYEFTLQNDYGSYRGTAKNDADGNIIFPEFTLPEGDYVFSAWAPTGSDGYVFTDAGSQFEIKVTCDGSGNAVAEVIDVPTFKVEYRPEGIKKPLQFHKIIDGWNLADKPDRQFSLVVSDHHGRQISMPVKDGVVDFGDFFLDESIHLFVKEEGTDGDGWILDKNEYPVNIKTTDDGKGHIDWIIDPPVPPFVNRYVPTPATTGKENVPHAKKTVTGGKPLEAGQFTFGLFDDKGNLVVTGTNDANGDIIFPVGEFNKPGEFNYILKETTPDGGGYTTDKTEYHYKAVITDDGKGHLSGIFTQPSPEPVFVNTYTTEGSEHILAYKLLHGWKNGLTAPQFNFTLRDKEGNIIKSLQSSGGTLDFGVLNYTEAGDYEYTVNEEAPLPDGWAVDHPSYRVIVHMTDDGKGGLIASVDYPDSNNTAPQFINTYSSVPANVGSVISGTPKKITTGKKQTDSEFRFGIFDTNGNLLFVGFNNADGTIRFPVFYSSKLGETDYFMKEISEDGNGWTCDKTSYPVKVNITDNGEGELSASVTYPDGVPAFENVYKDVPVTEKITAQKIIQGLEHLDKQFNFLLKDINGKIVKATQNKGDLIDFGMFNYTEPGTYVYTMEEDSFSAGAGWNTDPTVYPVVVTVTDDGSGNLKCQVSYPGGNVPVFTNFYINKPTKALIRAKKCVCGAPDSACGYAGYFKFGLFREDGEKIAQMRNDKNANIIFPELTFDSTGIYHYKLKELSESCNGWECDKKIVDVTITVTSDEQGELSANVTYDTGEIPNFTNYYKPCK
jgi:pilin isopeptide linkage protein